MPMRPVCALARLRHVSLSCFCWWSANFSFWSTLTNWNWKIEILNLLIAILECYLFFFFWWLSSLYFFHSWGLTDSVSPNFSSISCEVYVVSSFLILCSISSAESAFSFSLLSAALLSQSRWSVACPLRSCISSSKWKIYPPLLWAFINRDVSHSWRSCSVTSYHSGEE